MLFTFSFYFLTFHHLSKRCKYWCFQCKAIHRVALCFYKRHGLLITVWADQHITSQINVDVSVFFPPWGMWACERCCCSHHWLLSVRKENKSFHKHHETHKQLIMSEEIICNFQINAHFILKENRWSLQDKIKRTNEGKWWCNGDVS